VTVFGPLRLAVEGRDSTPTGPMQRTLLARLVAARRRLESVPGAPPTTPDRPHSAVPATGYTRELAILRGIATGAAAGRLRIAWIAGAAGVGKTTLAESLLAELADAGWTVARAACPEIDGAPPAWLLSELLEARDAADLAAAADAAELARNVVCHYRRRTTTGPVAVLFEDLHHADLATEQVLRRLAVALRDEPILVLLTTRSTESGHNVRLPAAGFSDVAFRLMDAAAGPGDGITGPGDTAAGMIDATAAWLRLTGLDLEAIREVAAAAGLSPVGHLDARILHRRSGGNPLFARELARHAATHGTLHGIPDSIRRLLDHRIDRLPERVVAVLTQLAAPAAGADPAALAAASGIGRDELIELIALAETARLVGTDRRGHITFTHELVRDTLRLRIPALRLRIPALRNAPTLPAGCAPEALLPHRHTGQLAICS
jgi:hypothetical protein